MDISGVDVDFLSDEEIFELCSDIVDCSNDEISVLNGVNVNSLSDDKIQELYNNIISINLQEDTKINNDIADENPDEIFLINGQKVNIDNMTNDEILTFYNEVIDTNENLFISSVANGSYSGTDICYSFYKTGENSVYTSLNIYCYDQNSRQDFMAGVFPRYSYNTQIATLILTQPSTFDGTDASPDGTCIFSCSGYKIGKVYCFTRLYSSIYKTYTFQYSFGGYFTSTSGYVCK